jgi:predicted DNA-binding transcriptional regulator AlpA
MAAALLTDVQAAERLNLKVQTLRKWRLEKVGPVYLKMGIRSVRYQESDLEEWIANCPRCTATTYPPRKEV